MKLNGLVVDEYGTERWFLNGLLHRLDGPAVSWSDGEQRWYQDGQQHRLDGPAAISADGAEAWYLNGLLHREDGPAAIYSDGTRYWYLDGQRIGFEQWLDLVATTDKERTFLALKWS